MRFIFLLALFTISSLALADVPDVRDGDIIFHTSHSSQSVAIQRATGSKFSHMGLILFQNGRPFVFEAVATVRFTALNTWIHRGVGGHYVVKRLRNSKSILNPLGRKALYREALKFQGRPYDLVFNWSDERIYCSELVWKAYNRALGLHIGELQKLKEFNLTDPLVKAKMHERYGNTVPLNEPVISPGAMYESPLLETVFDK